MYYIRFTEDIKEDIERGYSFNFFDKRKLNGLCAWAIMYAFNSEYDDEIIEAGKKTAEYYAKNSYAGYGSSTNFAVIEGELTGGYSNDGALIKVKKVLGQFSL